METIHDVLKHGGGADAYLRDCPSRTVLDVLASKWTTLIVPALWHGPMRFGELRRTLDGITQKSLTQSLRTLERDGLLTRTVYPTIPPRVEYRLTELGCSTAELFTQLRGWAELHMGDILAARTAYDHRTAEPVEPVPAG